MMAREITLEVSADPKLLSTVRAMVRSYLAEAGFDRERADEVVLGVDEACTNAIRHACKGCEDERFSVTFRGGEDYIEIQVIDFGEPVPAEVFEIRERTEPGHVSEIEPGGLGLHLIRQVFDEVTFCPGMDMGNCVIMRLRRPKTGRGDGR